MNRRSAFTRAGSWNCLRMTRRSCFSVAEALAAFPKETFDLALCDVDLPDGDGIVLAQALSRFKPSLAIVIVSGSLDNLARAHRAGLTARLQKPFELAALKSLVVLRAGAVDEPMQR